MKYQSSVVSEIVILGENTCQNLGENSSQISVKINPKSYWKLGTISVKQIFQISAKM